MAENRSLDRFLSFQARAEKALIDAVKLLNLNQEAEELLLKKKKGEDVFDYLGAIFSFQADNVRNQRDHVVHLLTNTQSILSGVKFEKRKSLSADDILKEAIDQVAEKTLENYDLWYKWLKLKTSRYFKRERLLLSCLYLLIWGEAANLRFMPECLCFIFHHMVEDLWLRPLMKSESFLRGVIKPIHVLLLSERERLNHTTSHTRWSNYDDFNELFWSSECLELFEWENKKFKLTEKVAESPKRGSGIWTRKSKTPEATPIQRDAENKWKNFVRCHSRKTNFLERRTFFHIFHSFHRLWIFLIIMLQGMIVVAFYGKLSVKNLLSLGPSHAVMMSIQSVLDLVFSYDPLRLRRFFVKSETSGHATKRHRGTHKFRMLAQLTFYAVWTGILTFLYVKVLLQPEDVVNKYYETITIVLAAYAGAHLAHGAGYTILSFFSSENKFVAGVKWLFKEQQFVGHNMRVKASDTLKYGSFWLILFALKFLVSYKFQIQPLVKPTKYIWRMSGVTYVWHDLVSEHNHNILTIASIWTPLILIYFLDVQIWYIVIAAFYGCISGGNAHLGEIRSLVTFVDVFHKLPGKFAGRLVHDFPSSAKDERRLAQAKVFAPYWNQIVTKLRDEDYLNNEEKELLLMSPQNLDVIQWPLFILINRVQLGLSMLKLNKEKQLFRKLHSDRYMRHAARDIYCCIELVLDKLVGLEVIWDMISVHNQGKLSDLRAEFLKTDKFGKSFKGKSNVKDLTELVCKLVKILHDTPEKNDIESALKALIKHFLDCFAKESVFKYEDFPGLDVGKLENQELKEIIGRLYKLLYSEDSALDVPTNDEARRRLLFFGNSLGMKIPEAPAIEKMLSFSVLTPHYDEVVLYSLEYLASRNKDGITNLYYLQLVYSDEWKFFLQRTGIKADEIAILAEIGEKDSTEEDYPFRKMRMEDLVKRKFFEELKKRKAFQGITDRTLIVDHALKCLRLWASYRGQTLARTVRGMMHYHDALRFQHRRDNQTETSELECRFVANLKFTYVVTCQEYSEARKSGNARARDIEYLLNMQKNPALAVAYVEKTKDGDVEKYESRLRMWEDDRVKDKYSIELPGNFLIGEGKPENQNHAIIFTRGDAVQTIDMNQDNYFEEALKMRNLLEEFKLRKYFKEDSKLRNDPEKLKLKRKKRIRRTILGVREHVYTGSVSSLAWFMSNQETSFVTLGQRVMANPLKVRMHYGHPDVFDRIFHITRGGVSKASKTINLSEDIFAGFNTTLRGGSVTHHEYIQVGKGRDLGLNQISAFEAKISSGNGEQMISRDVYRLGRYFDFGRMLSFYYTSVGYYVSTMLVLWALYAYLYGKIYLALSGVEDDMLKIKDTEQNEALQGALTTQFLFQIGFFNCIPMIMGYILEQGFLKAVQYFVLMSLLGSSIFFAFSLATRSHYFGRTLLHGGATYRKTGRGFVIEHIQFAENFRFYARSHFIKGLEIGMLLVLYAVYGSQRKTDYVLFSVSNWFLALCWLYAPFVFNPLGFEWQKSVEDISNWNKWLVNRNAGAKDVDSWTTWWEKQTEFRGNRARIFEIILSLRFFVVQYGVVYHLTENRGNNRLLVYGISWVLFVGVAAMLAFISVSTTSGNKLRLAHSVAFVVLFGSFTAGSITVLRFEVLDVLASVLALIPTGWGLLCVAVACKPLLLWGKVWWMVSTWAWCYDAAMGYFIFGPVIFLSWFPFISPLHTRILYNQAFSRGLEISVLLSGNRP